MNSTEQMIIAASIYFLTGLGIAVLYNNLKPRPNKKWKIDGIPIIPMHWHVYESMNALINAPKILRWFKKIEKTQIELRSILITDINWLSQTPDPNKLGIVKIIVNGLDKTTGKHIASNVFLKGESVAILIVVKVVSITRRAKQYVLLCDNMRVATGGRQSELCGGIMDNMGNIASAELKKVKKDIGFDIKNNNELIALGSILTSPSACDEEIFLYAWKTIISEEEFEEKQCCIFGNETEDEEIKLSFVPMKEMKQVILDIKDVKTECAFRRYIDLK